MHTNEDRSHEAAGKRAHELIDTLNALADQAGADAAARVQTISWNVKLSVPEVSDGSR